MNLLSKLHKNSILTGPVESYCLACDCLLRSEEESYTHISESEHRSKLEAIPQLENFKDDCIIKIREGYYCPYCNIILPTIKRVGLHITEPNHCNSKNSQSITRQSGVIFAYNKAVIDEKSWHGFDGSTCFVCNEDYNDEDQHRNEVTHVLNLIQSKCEFGETFIYRKVDEDSFFCLICGTIYYNDEKSNHHESEKHQQCYSASIKLCISIREKKHSAVNEPINNTLNVTIKKEVGIKKNTIDSKPKICANKSLTDEVPIKEPENKTTSSQIAKLKPEKVHISQDAKEIPQTSVITAKNPAKVDEKSNINKNKPHTEIVKIKNPGMPTTNNSNEKLQDNSFTENLQADTNESVPYIYNYLKACNFVIRTHGDVIAYCALCDTNVSNIDSHGSDKHHKVLHAKHIARNGLSGNTNRPVTADADKIKTNTKNSVIKSTNYDKENIALINEQANNQTHKATIKHDKSDIHNENKVKESKSKVPFLELENKQANVKPFENMKGSTTEDSKAGIETENVNPSEKLQTRNDETAMCKKIKESKKTVTTNTNVENISIKIEENITTVIEQAQKTESVAYKGPMECDCKNKSSATEKEKTNKKPENTEVDILVVSAKDETKPVATAAAAKKANRKIKKAARAKLETPKNDIPKETKPEDKPINEFTAENHLSKEIAMQADITDETSTKIEIVSHVNGNYIDHNNKSNTVNGDKMAAKGIDDMKIETEKLSNILKTVSQFDHVPDDLVVNGKYVLGNLSLVLIVNEAPNMKCVACNEVLTHDQLCQHISLESHRVNVEDSLVVTSLEDEFIRQVNSQAYHCGYCNLLLSSWTEMQGHLQCYRHKDAKTSASWRLERYHSHLRHSQTRGVRSILSSIRC